VILFLMCSCSRFLMVREFEIGDFPIPLPARTAELYGKAAQVCSRGTAPLGVPLLGSGAISAASDVRVRPVVGVLVQGSEWPPL
jgi:hypothetical protein